MMILLILTTSLGNLSLRSVGSAETAKRMTADPLKELILLENECAYCQA